MNSIDNSTMTLEDACEYLKLWNIHFTNDINSKIYIAKQIVKAEIKKNHTISAKLALGVFYKNQLKYYGCSDDFPMINDELYEMAVELLECGTTADDKYELAMAHKYYKSYLHDVNDLDKNEYLFNKVGTMLIDAIYNGSTKALATFINCHGDILYDSYITKKEFEQMCYYCIETASSNAMADANNSKKLCEYVNAINSAGRCNYLADIRTRLTDENNRNPALQLFMTNCRRTIKECGVCYKYKMLYNFCCGGAEHNYCINCIKRIQTNSQKESRRCPECREVCHPRYESAFEMQKPKKTKKPPSASVPDGYGGHIY